MVLGSMVPGGVILMPLTAAVGAGALGAVGLVMCMMTAHGPGDHLSHCFPLSEKFRGWDWWGNALALSASPDCHEQTVVTHLIAWSGRAERREFRSEDGRLREIIMVDESAPKMNSHVRVRLEMDGAKVIAGTADRAGQTVTKLREGDLRLLRPLAYEAASRQVYCGRPFDQIPKGDLRAVDAGPLYVLYRESLR